MDAVINTQKKKKEIKRTFLGEEKAKAKAMSLAHFTYGFLSLATY
jgi:hypothetical protein